MVLANMNNDLPERCDQRPNKVRFCIDKSKAQEVTKELYQRWISKSLDVLPKGGGKGHALAYLLNKLKAEGKLPVKILVCGNSGKDTELFTLNVYGVIRRGGVENCEAYVASLKASCHPGGVFVHPYGAEKSLRDTIDELGKNHGDKKDKKFPIWTDQVLATEATPRTWIVKLNKWEQTGN
uniref:Sucrose-phosphatase C-terminal domain-containing protein n=1 Tax=Brassica campestris TaxID=3711 RepID=M4E379_BRACM